MHNAFSLLDDDDSWTNMLYFFQCVVVQLQHPVVINFRHKFLYQSWSLQDEWNGKHKSAYCMPPPVCIAVENTCSDMYKFVPHDGCIVPLFETLNKNMTLPMSFLNFKV